MEWMIKAKELSISHIHTHTCALMPTHALIHKHAHTCTRSHSNLHIHSFTLMPTHVLIHTHAHTCTHLHSFTHMHSFALMHTHALIHTDAHTCTHLHSCTHMHTKQMQIKWNREIYPQRQRTEPERKMRITSNVSLRRGKATHDNKMMFAAMTTTIIQLQRQGCGANGINVMLISLARLVSLKRRKPQSKVSGGSTCYQPDKWSARLVFH